MGIERIEELVFGVSDIEASSRFYEDYGLEPLEVREDRATLRTLVNQTIQLRREDDPDLPPALETPDGSSSALREIRWGVDTQASLDAIAANLSADREVRVAEDGSLHTVDESGYAIAFALADKVEVEYRAQSINVTGDVHRWNDELSPYGRAHPLRICHIALDIPKAGKDEALRFYVERLNFRPVDIVKPTGVFLQAEGDWDQHNFLLMHRSDCYGINHAAFECRDLDEVIEGGNYMITKGWEEARYLGRHQVGSNIYRFFYAPTGGRVEYVCDMTRVDETVPTPRVWEEAPPHHVWLLKSSTPNRPMMDDVPQGSKRPAAPAKPVVAAPAGSE
jgi:catechol 2,3-dioxygenase-like lactoylglutathione lyase family enzyme